MIVGLAPCLRVGSKVPSLNFFSFSLKQGDRVGTFSPLGGFKQVRFVESPGYFFQNRSCIKFDNLGHILGDFLKPLGDFEPKHPFALSQASSLSLATFCRSWLIYYVTQSSRPKKLEIKKKLFFLLFSATVFVYYDL
jgi:hypothetical protein